MRLRIDTGSPVPLYHQIVEAVRYRIATGRLAAGDPLPTVRQAASDWSVNLHTVRRAYSELARAGLVESRPGRGTRVLGAHGRTRIRAGRLDEFLGRVLGEAREVHKLSADDLAALLANWSEGGGPEDSVVHVLECSEAQCAGHVRELASRWDVDARPWCLSQRGAPPEGALVATYFHYNDIRQRWPNRVHQVRFAAVRPDPACFADLVAGSVTLCELESAIGRNIAADVSSVLPRKTKITTRVVETPGTLLKPRLRTPVLFSPRTWGLLTDAQRAHPLAVEVRYVFPDEELEAIGQHFHWARIPTDERLRRAAGN